MDEPTLKAWVSGLFVSLLVGWVVVSAFLAVLKWKYEVEKPDDEKSVPPWLNCTYKKSLG